ncbi:DUF3040 domain-containing protein [Streptomyces sp. NRRL S-337]|uniref:DUF3040 domain-containing protein n=1 Tax=Streptomyces sp. NRRL S-337 TaxID=1463900 RepID=UPI0004CA81A5|nr:DUF3040 domain-containing protein [Streptomyces sp. NRRL S-337]
MTLPMHDRRVLADIERRFMQDDPDLALLLATFGASQPTHHRLAAALRRRVGAVMASVALTATLALLVAASAAGSTAVLLAAGGMALVAGMSKLSTRLGAGTRRRRARLARWSRDHNDPG